jgi:hypothetical protein
MAEAARQQKNLQSLTVQQDDRVVNAPADGTKTRKLMADVHAKYQQMDAARAELDRKLAAVKINKADVVTLEKEFELPAGMAERQLRLHDGDLNRTIKFFIGI